MFSSRFLEGDVWVKIFISLITKVTRPGTTKKNPLGVWMDCRRQYGE